jgi:hypothetical protein
VLWGLSLLVLLCPGVDAKAQSQARGVTVTGIVLDPTRAWMTDAAVTLSQGSDTVASAVTDSMGKFSFANVTDGNYSIEVIRDGFQRSVTPLRVRTTSPAPLTIVLALPRLDSQVSVEGDAPEQISTEIAENRDAASVNQSLLDQVPVFDEDYVATMSAFLDSASVGTGGPQLMVNGVEATNIPVSTSAIQEVRINQNPYSADISRPGRGTIDIITKEGTSEYHGTFNFIFRDSSLNARDPFSLTRAPEQRRIFEGYLSGPIGHSKSTSFLLSGHRQEEDLQSTVFAQEPSGLIQESVPSPKRDSQISLRIGHQFTANHAMYVQGNEWEYPSLNQGVGGFVLPEAGYNSKQWEREVLINDRWSITTKWLNQFQVLFGWEHHATYSTNPAPQIVVLNEFTAGGGQTDLLGTERHMQLNEIVSWSSGKHFVKFGLSLPDISQRGIVNHNNIGGTYIFASLADYINNNPETFKLQQGSGTVVYTQKEMGLFVQDDYKVRANFSISIGLRYNWQNYLHDNTQFAPRLAFAYSPDKRQKTVIRGGAGIFYDRTGPGAIGDLLLYNGQLLQSFTVDNPSYPNPGPLNEQPVDIVRFDPALKEPYTIQYSVGVERQLAKRTSLAVTYNGSVGISLFRSRDINAPLPPTYLVVPDPALGVVRQIESSGRQISNSLDVTLRGDVTRYFTGLAQYTISRTYNNTGGIAWFPANQYDLTGEWARADFDQQHRLNLLESFHPGKGFTLGVGLTLATGKPYTWTTGMDPYGTGFSVPNARPTGVPRNSLQGPGYSDLDLRLSRDFFLSKDKKEMGKVATIAFDAFDVLNHVNYMSYVGDQGSAFFGQPVSAFPTRRLQLTTRFKF